MSANAVIAGIKVSLAFESGTPMAGESDQVIKTIAVDDVVERLFELESYCDFYIGNEALQEKFETLIAELRKP